MVEKYNYINNGEDILHFESISDSCNVEIHLHDSYEIFLAMSDNIKYYIQGNSYDLAQFDIIITNDKEFHRPSVINNSPYKRHYIQFKPYFLQNLLYEGYNPLSIFIQRKPGEGNQLKLSQRDFEKVIGLFRKLEDTKTLELHQSNLLKKAVLIELLIVLETIYAKSHIIAAHYNDAKIKDIIQYIDKNFTDQISLEQLALSHFIDKYHLCHLFKLATGFSVFEYIQSKRIQYAKSLIANHVSITESSHQSGFNDYSNFYKAFKKLTLISPKEYRDSFY